MNLRLIELVKLPRRIVILVTCAGVSARRGGVNTSTHKILIGQKLRNIIYIRALTLRLVPIFRPAHDLQYPGVINLRWNYFLKLPRGIVILVTCTGVSARGPVGGGVKTSTHKMVNYLKCTINRHFWCNSDNNVYYSHYFANTAYSIMPIRP